MFATNGMFKSCNHHRLSITEYRYTGTFRKCVRILLSELFDCIYLNIVYIIILCLKVTIAQMID